MSDDPRIRIGHCCPDAPSVDVHVDGDPAFENVTFGELSEYATLDPGTHAIRVTPASGGDPVIETEVDLESNSAYTVLATGMLADITASVFEDEPGEVPANQSHVRFIHASPDAPSVSISVADGPTLFSDIGFGEASDYSPVDAGSYDLDVRTVGSDDAVLELQGWSFGGGVAYTAVAIGATSDGTLDAVLAEDEMPELPADD
jgi:hypothetical protein